MADNSSAQKTEEPTPKRIRETREKGQVARSREAGTLMVTLASVIAIVGTGAATLDTIRGDLRQALVFEAQEVAGADLLQILGQTLLQGLGWMMPLLVASVIGALAGSLLLGGWNFSSKAWLPDLKRLNPLSGFKRMVSVQGLSELLKGLAKFVLLGCLLAATLYVYRQELLNLGRLAWPQAPQLGAHVVIVALGSLCAGLLVVAAIDAPFQAWHYHKRLKMTLQEVKDERKESEGRPEVKQRVRQLQQQMSQRRLQERVPQADVVVSNPTHFSVALKYDADAMAAPQLIAKGRGPEAELIRKIAAENGIPRVEAPPLARALYRFVEVDQSVPQALYLAVAQILSYVYQLGRSPAEHQPDVPQPPIPEGWSWDPVDDSE